RDQDVHHNAVGPGYFEAMGIPVLAGRTFGPQDTSKSQKVGVIGETLARNMFPSGSPIGKHYGGGPDHAGDIEVIGVVKDVKYNNLNETQQPGDYLPHSQNVRYLNDLVLRYSGDLSSVTSAVRQTIHDVDPALPIADLMTLDTAVSQSITNQRLVAQLSAFFALLALFLSSIGIYGLMSYSVVRRTNEIGLRMALGAEPRNVTWMVLKESLLLVLMGTAIGIPTALAGGQVVQSMLFGLPGKDVSSLLAGAAVLLVVAAFAGYLPARRASMVDPLVSLRYE
ncbi:MAG TPA: FtsX-like permease family protein, partial [Candidatus Acidoferrum sp.]|nr:FtsX-like permease family protein [Candidatus Acidoferrum sp.]